MDRARRLVCTVAACAMVAVTGSAGIASGEARTITFYHIHTKETLTVTYKRDGKYIPDAMEKIDWLMRDWRKNEKVRTDPETVDIIWEMYNELGSQVPVHVICGYRSHGTNEMLRRTRGGQASQSQHITGKAIDVAFPDVPIKRLRYSAMIRERGGVGYYPTSAIPFIHVDTSRVRHWPRMPKDELALLFPSGRSKHSSAGGPISPGDVTAARARNKALATQVAEFFDLRSKPRVAQPIAVASTEPAPTPEHPKPFTIAAADPPPTTINVPLPVPAMRPAKAPAPPRPPMALGAATPQFALASSDQKTETAAPALLVEPKMGERPSHFRRAVDSADRGRLNDMAKLAAYTPSVPQSEPPSESKTEAVVGPPPAARPDPKQLNELIASLHSDAPAPSAVPNAEPNQAPVATASLTQEPAPAGTEPVREGRFGWAMSFAAAPAYDDDHPDELSYQPFPIAPMLTDTPSPDDPALAKLVHPDVARTLDMLDDEGAVLPMKLRPGQQVAQILWAQQFAGNAVSLDDLQQPVEKPEQVAAASRPIIAERAVTTLSPR